MSTPPETIAEPIPFGAPTDPTPWAVQVENLSKAMTFTRMTGPDTEVFGNRTHHQQHWPSRIHFEVSEGQSFGSSGQTVPESLPTEMPQASLSPQQG